MPFIHCKEVPTFVNLRAFQYSGFMGNSTPNFFLIYLAAFISVVAFSMVFPLLPVYAKYFQASDITIGLLAASFAIAQLLFSPFWGVMSDRFGRRPIIIIGLLGLSLSFLIFAFAANLLFLFVFRFIQGIFSGATMPAARAYIADITTKELRIAAMGRIGAALALGIILGPAIGGLLAQHNIVLPFFAAAVVSGLNLLLVYFFLPESLQKKKFQAINLKLTFGAFSRIWQGLKSSLAPLFFLAFIWSFVISNNQVNVPLLASDQFQLDAGAIGLSFALMGIVSVITQFFLLSPITNLFGQQKTIAGGLIIMTASFIIMPFLPLHPGFLYLAMIGAGFGSAVARPIITALITKETKEPQGITLGTANAFESIGRLLGPLLGGFLFMFGHQVPFLFSGTVAIFMVFFVWRYTNFLKQGHT